MLDAAKKIKSIGSRQLSRLRKAYEIWRQDGLNALARRIREKLLWKNRYKFWVARYDTLNEEDLGELRLRLKDFRRRPLISLLMPVYDAPEKWLRLAIESVQAQVYVDWELCIADDASTLPHVRQILEKAAAGDERIKLVFRAGNGHISAASNSALELASGEFIALMDQDDVLPPQALFRVAEEILEHPETMLIYSDEDKLGNDGKRFDPIFKPDWNPDLFLAQNMICHLGVYRTSLVREIGGFRLRFEGAQDYDLALRFIERIKPEQIRHIPQVLYHWRAITGSTAVRVEEKPYAFQAARKAISEHLHRMDIDASVEESEARGMSRVRYALPFHPPVSIIIATRNGFSLLSRCIESILRKTDYPNYEILVVDNGSDDSATLSYLDDLAESGKARILRDDRAFNYSALNNGAVKEAKGAILCLLNNDIEVINPDWLTEMVSQALRSEIGAVGARLWYPNDTLQHAGVILGIGGVAGHIHKDLQRGRCGYISRAVLCQNLSAVTGACLVIRREVYDEVGGLNEELAIAFNDVDLCLKVKEAGYRNLWTPYAELYHHESASRGSEDTPAKRARFAGEAAYMEQRWKALLKSDPAYNPNLTLERVDFTLAFPPRTVRASRRAELCSPECVL